MNKNYFEPIFVVVILQLHENSFFALHQIQMQYLKSSGGQTMTHLHIGWPFPKVRAKPFIVTTAVKKAIEGL